MEYTYNFSDNDITNLEKILEQINESEIISYYFEKIKCLKIFLFNIFIFSHTYFFIFFNSPAKSEEKDMKINMMNLSIIHAKTLITIFYVRIGPIT